MKTLSDILNRPRRLVIGLMSGTSADGVDAALTAIEGHALTTRVELLAFASVPFPKPVRERILALALGETGGAHELCLMSFLLGRLFVDASRAVCAQAGVAPEEIDLIGSHGQTLWHIPRPEPYLGVTLTGTLQLGEASLLNEAFACPVVSDFRVRDVAAGGQGAPLVPYTEYLLYRKRGETVALQNIGGIGNLTLLPAGGRLADTIAFDTGPGNMVLDALVSRFTGGAKAFDEGGRFAAGGRVSQPLLRRRLEDPYLMRPPPKTTGRERYGAPYVDELLANAAGLSPADTLATATCFTAECIRTGIMRFCSPRPDTLIVGGGGSKNQTLLHFLRAALPDTRVLTNEDIGLNSDAKEAIAFAILANECIHASPSNAPRATGASHPAVLGKISL